MLTKFQKSLSEIFSKNKFIFIFSIILFLFSQYSLNHFPTGLFEDDTYFYYTTAYNSLINGFITFDGISSTNGFHPLWMIILITCGLPLKLIGLTNPFIFGTIFNGISTLVWFFVLSKFKSIWSQILAASFSLMTGFGMEGALAGLIIIEIFECYFKKNPIRKNWLFLPLILTRIDLSLTAIILALKEIKLKSIKELQPFLIIAIGIVLTLIFNFIVGGYPFSVTSLVKTNDLGFHNFILNLTQGLGNQLRYLLIFAVSSIFLYLISTSKREAKLRDIKLPDFKTNLYLFAASSSFLIFHTFLGSTRDWYFAPTGISLIFLLDKYINKKNFNKKKVIIFLLIIITSLEFTAASAYFYKERQNSLLASDFVNRTKNIIPEKSRIYIVDGSGYLSWAFLPEINVINGDGLVNSISYYKMILKKRVDLFLDYIKRNEIQYNITNGAFEHCLGNPYIYGKCDQFKNYKDIKTSKEYIYGTLFEVINGEKILESKSKRNFMRYKLFKYPDSILKN